MFLRRLQSEDCFSSRLDLQNFSACLQLQVSSSLPRRRLGPEAEPALSFPTRFPKVASGLRPPCKMPCRECRSPSWRIHHLGTYLPVPLV